MFFRKFLIIFIVITGLSFVAVWIYSQLYSSPSAPSDEQLRIFTVRKGEGLSEIAHELKREELVKSKLLFSIYVFMKGKHNSLKAGEYSLSPSMSISEIAQKIIQGKTAGTKITIIEGWNLQDIAQYLEEKGICQKESFLETTDSAADFVPDFDFLQDKPEETGLEGYLFPDTYQIKKTDSAEDITRMMLVNFDKKMTPEIRSEIRDRGKTIFEIVTMASLLEKEVRTKEDKEIVAGILWKRLKYGMPLQVDATVSYITGKKTTKVLIKDTKIDSPYNTYKYPGLPIGPICNPGFESILAAIRPQESNFWYYLSTPEGETIFSPTLKHHNWAKNQYLGDK